MNSFSDLLNYYEALKFENNQLKIRINTGISNYNRCFKYVNFLEQKRLWNHVDILGVPACNDNCVSIIEQIGAYLGVELSVVKASYIPSKIKNKQSKIVVELESYEQKETFMETVKTNNLNAKHLNENWSDMRIFVNHSLTTYNRHLYYKARMFAKDKGFRFVWFRDCKLYVKRDETSNAYLIEDEMDLLTID